MFWKFGIVLMSFEKLKGKLICFHSCLCLVLRVATPSPPLGVVCFLPSLLFLWEGVACPDSPSLGVIVSLLSKRIWILFSAPKKRKHHSKEREGENSSTLKKEAILHWLSLHVGEIVFQMLHLIDWDDEMRCHSISSCCSESISSHSNKGTAATPK